MPLWQKGVCNMSNLHCSVNSCQNNCVGLCSLTSIRVRGDSANSSSETNCASYRAGGSASNSLTDSATPETAVACKACNCTHNEDCTCTAGSVSIENCGCGHSAGCKTFKE